VDDADQPDEPAASVELPIRRRWWQRQTIQSLRQEHRRVSEISREWDQRENDESRLPDGESVHLAGLVLVEAFTPSTVSNLYDALARMPIGEWDRVDDWRERVTRSRTSGGGGWQNLGVLRPPGQSVLGMGGTAELPAGVSAVWLSVHYEMPSVAVLVATFTLDEDAGDLSPVLRSDYRMEHYDVRIRVYGVLGGLRARLPWARPARHARSSKVARAMDQKRRAVDQVIGQHESACRAWFHTTFRGRFADARDAQRPAVRLIVTEEARPFEVRRSFLEPVGLDWSPDVWRPADNKEGWALSFDRWPHRSGGRFSITMAARRKDAGEERNGEDGSSNWYLTQRLAADESSFPSRHALLALIHLYADRLAELRDAPTARRRRPVAEAQALVDYLSRDGLDIATITRDLRVMTEDARHFAWNLPDYAQDRTHWGRPPTEDPPRLVEGLRRRLTEQAARLEIDVEATTGAIRASAELRQAVSNTRLQRIVLAVSGLALLVSVTSLIISR
jgi:hypothetical protein